MTKCKINYSFKNWISNVALQWKLDDFQVYIAVQDTVLGCRIVAGAELELVPISQLFQ